MNKKLLLSLGIVAMLLVGGIAYFSKSADAAGFKNQNMMQEGVEQGIISEDQAQKLQNYHQEQVKQRMQENLDQAVSDGTITQEEAQEIKNWHDSRPEAMNKLKNNFGKGQKAGNCQ